VFFFFFFKMPSEFSLLLLKTFETVTASESQLKCALYKLYNVWHIIAIAVRVLITSELSNVLFNLHIVHSVSFMLIWFVTRQRKLILDRVNGSNKNRHSNCVRLNLAEQR